MELKFFQNGSVKSAETVLFATTCVFTGGVLILTLWYLFFRQPTNTKRDDSTDDSTPQQSSSNKIGQKTGSTTETKVDDATKKPATNQTEYANELSTGNWPVEQKTSEMSTKCNPTDVDPVTFCGHIQSEMKKTQHRVAVNAIEKDMTTEQREEEQRIQRQQLENIFKLMNDQKEKFGIENMDDMDSQVKLYM